MTSNYNDTFSADLNKRRETFFKKLEEIEAKNAEWFKKRPSIFDQDKHDTIKNHIFSEEEGGYFRFTFWKYSELPESIKTDCLSAYNELFGSEVAA